MDSASGNLNASELTILLGLSLLPGKGSRCARLETRTKVGMTSSPHGLYAQGYTRVESNTYASVVDCEAKTRLETVHLCTAVNRRCGGATAVQWCIPPGPEFTR